MDNYVGYLITFATFTFCYCFGIIGIDIKFANSVLYELSALICILMIVVSLVVSAFLSHFSFPVFDHRALSFGVIETDLKNLFMLPCNSAKFIWILLPLLEAVENSLQLKCICEVRLNR